jgi:hypothetical protein
MSGKRIIHAPRGIERSCKGWHQEAAMRMLMNNLDPDVAEAPFARCASLKMMRRFLSSRENRSANSGRTTKRRVS